MHPGAPEGSRRLSQDWVDFYSIESADEYQTVLVMLQGLLDLDPQPGSAVAERCRIFAELLGVYEKKNFEKLTKEMG